MRFAKKIVLPVLLICLLLSTGAQASRANFPPSILQFDNHIERVSISQTNAEGNNHSGWGGPVAISSDGRYIAFESLASNLVEDDLNSYSDIFVYDRQTGIPERVSNSWNGSETTFGSYSPSISNDGRYVAFTSAASNIVEGDTNPASDIFIFDRVTKKATLASVDSDGVQGFGDASMDSVISGDGKVVAFISDAALDGINPYRSVYVHNMVTGTTQYVVKADDGTSGNDGSWSVAISNDGRYVAFDSLASNLVPGDENMSADVFVRDLQTGKTTLVSSAIGGGVGDATSWAPSISGDGRYVAFQSFASNLAPCPGTCYADIFVKDLQTGTLSRVSLADDGNVGNDSSYEPSISTDGRYVAFYSNASNLVSGIDTNSCPGGDAYSNGHCADVLLRDRVAQRTYLVSGSTLGFSGNDWSDHPAIATDNGLTIAFKSQASDLVGNDTNGFSDVFIRSYNATASIAGQVVDEGGNPIAGVTIPAATGYSLQVVATATTGSDGRYAFNGLFTSTYMLSPYKPGYLFEPNQVVINLLNQTNQNFTGSQAGKKPWLFMFYLAGDNNTSENSRLKFERLKQYAGSPLYNIAVMYDGNAMNDSRYYYISSNTIVTAKGELDSGDPATLIDFVRWAKDQYPYEHSVLIMGGHGSLAGAMTDEKDGLNSDKPSMMDLQELGNALTLITSQQGKFDILYMDACLMGSIEAAYQFRNTATYYIASESIAIPNFEHYLSKISGSTSPEELAILIAKEYESIASQNSWPYTITVGRLSVLPDLVNKVSLLADSLRSHIQTIAEPLRTQILNSVQRYDTNTDCVLNIKDEAFDLYDFSRLVYEQVIDIDIQLAAFGVMTAIQDDPDPSSRYILFQPAPSKATIPGRFEGSYCPNVEFDLRNSHGVSIFFVKPDTKRSFYNGSNLDFAIGTDWEVYQRSALYSRSSDLLPTIGWGPMLVSYVDTVSPNAMDDSTFPPLVSLVLPPYFSAYLPYVRK